MQVVTGAANLQAEIMRYAEDAAASKVAPANKNVENSRRAGWKLFADAASYIRFAAGRGVTAPAYLPLQPSSGACPCMC